MRQTQLQCWWPLSCVGMNSRRQPRCSHTLSLIPVFLSNFLFQIVHQSFKRNESTRLSRLAALLIAVPTCVFFTFGDRSEGVFPGLCKGLVRFQLLLISSILAYRLSPWHPLARYPGPLLCKATKIYWAVVNRNGNQHKLVAALHERYGDIVRIGACLSLRNHSAPLQFFRWDLIPSLLFFSTGPNEVSVINPSAIDPLMGPSGQPKGQCGCPSLKKRFKVHT